MTTAENERLAVVETKVDAMQATVGALDVKLDTVVLYIAGEKSARAERRRESEFRRWLMSVGLPAAISIIGFVAGRLAS